MRIGPVALLIALAVPAHAQDESAPDSGAMRGIEAIVPPQSWYPEGYYDVRIAAETQTAESPRLRELMFINCIESRELCYDAFDPVAEQITLDENDKTLSRYGNIALEISRLRQELVVVGYPVAVYAPPLAAFERRLVKAAASDHLAPASIEIAAVRQFVAALEFERQRLTPDLPRVVVYGGRSERSREPGSKCDALAERSMIVRSSGPSTDQYSVGKKFNRADKLVLKSGDQVVLVQGGGTRTLTGPGMFCATGMVTASAANSLAVDRMIRPWRLRPRAGAMGLDRGAPLVVVKTSPPGGAVLLVSAFAFKLCARKQQDMWDRFACKWNEIETGVARSLSGRYVYQVQWPDGMVRKGTREILHGDRDTVTTVTFKKTGS